MWSLATCFLNSSHNVKNIDNNFGVTTSLFIFSYEVDICKDQNFWKLPTLQLCCDFCIPDLIAAL